MKDHTPRYAIIAAICLFVAFPARAQVCHWAQRSSSMQGDQQSSDHAVDSKGNRYIAAWASKYPYESSMTLTVDTITIPSSTGFVYIAKHNAAGRVKWVKRTAGGDLKLANDKTGALYMTGYFNRYPIVYGSTTLIPADTTTYDHNLFVVKMDSNGNYQWARSATQAGYEVDAMDITTDKDNNVYVTGYFSGTGIDFGSGLVSLPGNAFLAKYSPSGTFLWAKGMGSATVSGAMGTVPERVTTDADGNIFVTGEFYNPTVTFGSTVLSNMSASSSNVFLAKYAPSGALQWARVGGGSSWEKSMGLVVDRAGNAYIGGAFFSSVTHFGTLTGTNFGSSTNLMVVKYSKDGTEKWIKVMGGGCASGATDMAITRNDDIFILGALGDHPFGTDGAVSVGNCAVIMRMDTTSHISCALEKAADATGSGMWSGLTADNDGYVTVSGYCSGPHTIGTITLPGVGGANTILGKVSCGPLPPPVTEVGGPAIAHSFVIYPDPAQDELHVDGIEGPVDFSVLNMHGALVKGGALSQLHNTVDVSSLSPGMYILQLKGRSGEISTIKVVKQ